ncbi:metallophosphoesterase family protein [Bradyrhizobium uaiense]|uniref:Serine/threonine protein phosphatase n=1 Tax=Bradyrhizobium uaiense TaxID=2594946 RepID=A0A6P1BKZ1_9BRAD|nr:metallophosphoesterase family protein [Bradyrhizobium uaiense]NEU98879.1 serine/threonine protein phosphatase [Bradyrhizobium uaiense]
MSNNDDLVTFAIGDIHGCLEMLRVTLASCRSYADGRPTKFVMLGDYIDRGPDSRGVVDWLVNWDGPEQLICLKGNHEDMLIAALERPERSASAWLKNGGQVTLWNYGVMYPHQLPYSLSNWIKGMPLSHDDGERFFVHAGIDPAVSLDHQTEAKLMYSRTLYPDDIDVGRYIVHGHTIVAGVPVPGRNSINVDTGACAGGSLSAAAFVPGRRLPVAIISDDLVVELQDTWSPGLPR